MKTKTKPQTKRNTKEVAFRDMIEHLHCFIENLNMAQAQTPDRNHDERFRAIKTNEGERTSHLFIGKDYTVVIAVNCNEKGGIR